MIIQFIFAVLFSGNMGFMVWNLGQKYIGLAALNAVAAAMLLRCLLR